MSTHIESDLADDLLPGVEAIAAYLGFDKRQVDWQIRKGQIPVTRMGRLIIGSKRALRARFYSSSHRLNCSRLRSISWHVQEAMKRSLDAERFEIGRVWPAFPSPFRCGGIYHRAVWLSVLAAMARQTGGDRRRPGVPQGGPLSNL